MEGLCNDIVEWAESKHKHLWFELVRRHYDVAEKNKTHRDYELRVAYAAWQTLLLKPDEHELRKKYDSLCYEICKQRRLK